jgi:hypothetical protein
MAHDGVQFEAATEPHGSVLRGRPERKPTSGSLGEVGSFAPPATQHNQPARPSQGLSSQQKIKIDAKTKGNNQTRIRRVLTQQAASLRFRKEIFSSNTRILGAFDILSLGFDEPLVFTTRFASIFHKML